jgi:tetratricopeptide (TPR) repeat protein
LYRFLISDSGLRKKHCLLFKEKDMLDGIRTRLFFAILILACILPGAAWAAPKKASGASGEMFDQAVAELQKNPGDKALREKIIKLALSMKPAPAVPEDAERNMARGVVFFTKATDNAGYHKAIVEFEAATNAAPWLDKAYYNLGVAQEKAGMFKEAIRSLKLYLLADPNAKNAREVRNQIYMLEANVEDVQTLPSTAATPAAPAAAAAGAAGAAAAAPGITVAKPAPLLSTKASLDIEKDIPLKVVKLPPPDKKSKIPSFIGSWSFKELRGTEEAVVQGFEIVNNNGELSVLPPNRGENNVGSVREFEITEKTVKVQIKWKMKNVPAYWKTETYDLTMSDDGKTLSGSYNQQSVGGRNKYLDKELFRQ